MLTIGSVSFAVPWALAGLGALPLLWWLLRITPPQPRTVGFPPVRLLFGLAARQETPERSPPWLLILRLILVAALVAGAAHPLLNAAAGLAGKGPLILVVDDGWAAARDWLGRRSMLLRLIDQADRQGRAVVLVTTAPAEGRGPARPTVQPMPAAEARIRAETLAPKPWPTDRAAALAPLTAPGSNEFRDAPVVWLSDGLAQPPVGGSVTHLAESLGALGPLTVATDAPGRPRGLAPGQAPGRALIVLRPPVAEGTVLRVAAVRASGSGAAEAWLRALDAGGGLLARQPLSFADGARRAEARLELPAELRNRLARLEIEDETTAGAVILIDERWRRRPVGLLGADGAAVDQPLLSARHYLARALDPFTEVRLGTVAHLLSRELAVMVLPDPPPLDAGDRRALEGWIDGGGVAVRFAGPRLAEAPDTLLPVEITAGDRTIGGTMSWQRPVALAPFDEGSPFFGLDPQGGGTESGAAGDIRIRRQVLARPALDLAAKTWARLDDGTPLVTAERRGKGWLVLVHTTADTTWSDLPLSGLFVHMLKRLVALSAGVVAQSGGPPLEPLEALDGFGRLGPAPKGALAISADGFETTPVGPRHPPGIYGDAAARRALNLSVDPTHLRPLAGLPSRVSRVPYGAAGEVDLRPWLLGLALLLMVVDLAISLALRGLLVGARAAAAALVLLAGIGGGSPARAQGADLVELSLTTRMAYIITGDDRVDEISHAGLRGLSVIVNRRTAAELAEPVGVDAETDELVFFPLLYWPLTAAQPRPSPVAVGRLNAYLLGGGTILFDTRDAAGGGGRGLRDLVGGLVGGLGGGLDIPRLRPISTTHVLSRAYYLIDAFPGRWTGGTLWVEAAGERVNDGVSSVIVGSHDWAAAWAMDDLQRPLFAVVPGGEGQREMAYRFGINLVMYTLTGNYKTDQVHLPEIMKRLGNERQSCVGAAAPLARGRRPGRRRCGAAVYRCLAPGPRSGSGPGLARRGAGGPGASAAQPPGGARGPRPPARRGGADRR